MTNREEIASLLDNNRVAASDVEAIVNGFAAMTRAILEVADILDASLEASSDLADALNRHSSAAEQDLFTLPPAARGVRIEQGEEQWADRCEILEHIDD